MGFKENKTGRRHPRTRQRKPKTFHSIGMTFFSWQKNLQTNSWIQSASFPLRKIHEQFDEWPRKFPHFSLLLNKSQNLSLFVAIFYTICILVGSFGKVRVSKIPYFRIYLLRIHKLFSVSSNYHRNFRVLFFYSYVWSKYLVCCPFFSAKFVKDFAVSKTYLICGNYVRIWSTVVISIASRFPDFHNLSVIDTQTFQLSPQFSWHFHTNFG